MTRSLADNIRRIDGAGYGRYKSLSGRWEFDGFSVDLQRIQADPFAPPSRILVHIPDPGLPGHLWRTPVRATALASFLVRTFAENVAGEPFLVDSGGQQVLARSSCEVHDGAVTLRFGVQLPGPRRRVAGRQAERALCERLPAAVAALRWSALDQDAAAAFVASVEDTDALRGKLAGLGLVAFVADGAILPRASGIDDRPLSGDAAVPFATPDSLRADIELPNRGTVTGMGIPEGVTLVVGGGFHGKSTLLRALERGIYDHVPGDGRELVVSRPDTVKIRAEDGRRVQRVDVRAFVDRLPTGTDTADFCTENASGSTSQAANIIEAVEAGAKVLLVDEDTAATNLMIRDARMQELVGRSAEPLTPFVDLVQPLRAAHGVSTVLVMGGSGDYLDVADRVLLMAGYHASDITVRAAEIASTPTGRHVEADTFPPVRHRIPDPDSVAPQGDRRPRIKHRGTDSLTFGEAEADLRAVEQLVDPSQLSGIGVAVGRLLRAGVLDGRTTIADALARYRAEFGTVGALADGYPGDFVVPRWLEVAAALNRLRSMEIRDFRP